MFNRPIQFFNLLFTKEFSSENSIYENTKRRYSKSYELKNYVEIANKGLYDFEKVGVCEALKLIKKPRRCLIIGCGTGREAFEVASSFEEVWAIDNNQEMINQAKQLNSQKNINFINSDKLDHNIDFDFIYCNAYLSSNIPGKEQRKRFFSSYLKLLSDNGILIYYPDIFDIKSTLRYRIAGHILRIKFMSNPHLKWELGDTIRNYLGDHSSGYFPIYYHYYQSMNDFIKTLPDGIKINLQKDDLFILLSKDGKPEVTI